MVNYDLNFGYPLIDTRLSDLGHTDPDVDSIGVQASIIQVPLPTRSLFTTCLFPRSSTVIACTWHSNTRIHVIIDPILKYII